MTGTFDDKPRGPDRRSGDRRQPARPFADGNRRECQRRADRDRRTDPAG
jgi:hypothetical protein